MTPAHLTSRPLALALGLSLGLSAGLVACDDGDRPAADDAQRGDATALDRGVSDGGRTDARAPEAGPDAATDAAGAEAGPDAQVDAGLDAEVDAGPPRTRPRFALGGPGFYDTPWPADARLTAAGTPDLSNFPPGQVTLARITEEIQSNIKGFATMPVVFVAFDDPIEGLPLPTPADVGDAEAVVQLVGLGAECGRRVPVEAEVRIEGSDFIPSQTLQVKNTVGTLLSPGVPYGLVVLRDFGATEGRPAEPTADFEVAWAAADPAAGEPAGPHAAWARSLRPLRACLPTLGLDAARVAVATVFTPHDPVAELVRLHDLALDPVQTPSRAPTALGLDEGWSRRRLRIRTFSGLLPMPVFQAGAPPYQTEGGAFVFAADGTPQLQRWEDVPVAAAWRTFDEPAPDAPPAAPRPVLVFIDGTGWDRWDHLGGSWMRTALDAGFVVFSFMPQFHGGRAGTTGGPELPSFNFLNPPAGRSNFRQQAVETAYFARAIREQLDGLEGLPAVDTARIVYGGHSQGALVGAITAAVTGEYAAYLLNGLSSYLSLTILNRKDLLDFERVVRGLLGNPGPLDLFAPALSLMQIGSESVDPHNFARLWRGTPARPAGNHVFVINGFTDDTTTPRGMDHLTLSADLPVFDPPGWDLDPLGVTGGAFSRVALPAAGNALDLNGDPLTLATYLDPTEGHFTIHRSPLLQQMGVRFWQTALSEGLPRLQPDRELMCGDGGDDDQDGLTDCDDSDCAAREPCVETRCDDGLDGDGDGLVDCEDPDCVTAVACRETDCGNGEDDDGDGLVDCEDPDCAAREPCREVLCADRLDGDGDGLVDCADPDCAGTQACRETSCSDGRDNNRDGLTDCEDPQCLGSLACPEPSCDDGTDEDGNGLTDCADPRCFGQEVCPSPAETACADGLDDDGDGRIDCADPDCATDAACAAPGTCADGDLGEAVGIAVYQGTLAGRADLWPPGDCTALGSGEGAPDLALRFTAPAAGTYTFSTLGSPTDTVLTLRADGCPAPEVGAPGRDTTGPNGGPRAALASERACGDDQPGVITSAVTVALGAGEAVLVVVSAFAAPTDPEAGAFVLHILRAGN